MLLKSGKNTEEIDNYITRLLSVITNPLDDKRLMAIGYFVQSLFVKLALKRALFRATDGVFFQILIAIRRKQQWHRVGCCCCFRCSELA